MGRDLLTESGSLYLVGLGLIGGSLARGLRDSGWTVRGWDRDPDTREAADRAEVLDGLVPPEELSTDPDLVLLAVPVPAMKDVVDELIEVLPESVVWTDVGSTKQWITEFMDRRLPDGHRYVGGHPMAGSEESGFEAGDPLLFENALCVLTGPSEGPAFERVAGLWDCLGAHVVTMDALLHDRLVGNISHLPHLAAAALLHVLDRLGDHRDEALPLAAGGFRDVTRVAEGDPDLWKDILQTNQPRIVESIRSLRETLREAEELLEEERWDRLADWLEEARGVRREIPEKTKGLLGTLHELRVQAPDRPGILATITTRLGEENINIRDLEVLRVREGELGTLRLAFRDPEDRDRAREVLREAGEGFTVI